MKRRTFVTGAVAAGASLATARAVFAQEETVATPAAEGEAITDTAAQSGYAPVNGLQMYYEVHGEGEPLVLLHGAFSAISMYGPAWFSLRRITNPCSK